MSKASPNAPAWIVVVDDGDSVRDVTEMVLAGAGHSVRATANGLEADHAVRASRSPSRNSARR